MTIMNSYLKADHGYVVEDSPVDQSQTSRILPGMYLARWTRTLGSCENPAWVCLYSILRRHCAYSSLHLCLGP
jgi:hypothetical protein